MSFRDWGLNDGSSSSGGGGGPTGGSFIPLTEKGQPGGVATLNSQGELTAAQIPPGIGGTGPANTDELSEGTANLYYTEARVRSNDHVSPAYSHSQLTSGNPHGITPATISAIPSSEKGAANGLATLNASGKLLITQLPTGVLEFKGTWDASTNTPTLSSGAGAVGDVYIVTVAGSTALDGTTSWAVGDWAIFDITNTWEKISREDVVTSVNGKTGAVVVHVNDLPVFTLAELNAKISDGSLDITATPRPPSGVAGGDLVLSFPNPQVAKIRSYSVADTAPAGKQALVWESVSSLYRPSNIANSVAGLTGDITAEELSARLTTGLLTPSVTNFHTTAPTHVAVGTDLSGQAYEAEYDIINPHAVETLRIIGESSTVPGTIQVLVASASSNNGANTQQFVFPAGSGSFFASVADTYTLTIEGYTAGQIVGTDTPATSQSQQIVAQAVPRTDVFYYGSTDSTDASTLDVTTLSSSTKFSGNFTFPTFTGFKHLVFANPGTQNDITQLVIGANPTNQISGFTKTDNAIIVQGVEYDVYISDQALSAAFYSGTAFTITR